MLAAALYSTNRGRPESVGGMPSPPYIDIGLRRAVVTAPKLRKPGIFRAIRPRLSLATSAEKTHRHPPLPPSLLRYDFRRANIARNAFFTRPIRWVRC